MTSLIYSSEAFSRNKRLRSVPFDANKQVYKLPSADKRMRLQSPQNASVTEVIRPISPSPSNLNDATTPERLAELDAAWGISTTGNNEVLFAWLEQSIRSQYQPSYARLERFLVEIGRRKFLTPLYKAMVDTDQKAMADSIYAKADLHMLMSIVLQELSHLFGVVVSVDNHFFTPDAFKMP